MNGTAAAPVQKGSRIQPHPRGTHARNTVLNAVSAASATRCLGGGARHRLPRHVLARGALERHGLVRGAHPEVSSAPGGKITWAFGRSTNSWGVVSNLTLRNG
jgi:hypothetical protein